MERREETPGAAEPIPNVQRWEVSEYKYSITVLKYQVSVLYLSIYFSGDFLLVLPTFVHKFLYFLQLTMETHSGYLCVEKTFKDTNSVQINSLTIDSGGC